MLATGMPIRPWVQPERLGEVDCSTSSMGYMTERIWNTEPRKLKSRIFVGCGFCFLWAFIGKPPGACDMATHGRSQGPMLSPAPNLSASTRALTSLTITQGSNTTDHSSENFGHEMQRQLCDAAKTTRPVGLPYPARHMHGEHSTFLS